MINREYKDRLFTFLFGSPDRRQWTLSLYNAVSGSSYTDPASIQITTMDDVIYMGMKNDVSFLISGMMNIFEQQSTFNPNMPVRMLMYAGKLYDKHIHLHRLNIYGTSLVRLPIPRLVVFYNGTKDKDDTVLKLSSAFCQECGTSDAAPDIEVRVRMLNINLGHNTELMDKCKPLAEYAWLIDHIRNYGSAMDIGAAVDKALLDMPEDFLIRPCLFANKTEVRNMCITEYNEAETMQLFMEEGRREGRRKGQKEGENRLGQLMQLLLSRGLTEDAQKAATDESARYELYRQYGITGSADS